MSRNKLVLGLGSLAVIFAFFAVHFDSSGIFGPRIAVSADQVAVTTLIEKYRRPSTIPYPEENPYTKAKYELGQALYFDPRLSKSNGIYCATCHNPSFSWGDGLPLGVGHGSGVLGRRSPTILNAAWGEVFMWNGRFGTLEE